MGSPRDPPPETLGYHAADPCHLSESFARMRRFRPTDLKARLAQAGPAPLLLDVREPWEYEICHIEGSRLVPMGQLPAVVESMARDAEIVVICHHGIRSRHVCRYLAHLGFEDLTNLEGGVEAWADEVDTSMPRY